MTAPAQYPPTQTPAGPRHRTERSGGRGVLVGVGAAVFALVIAAAGVAVFMMRDRGPSGPDPFAGSYPVVGASAAPSAGITWQPSGPPAGPLRHFSGRPSPVIGKILDRKAGLGYDRLGAPWKLLSGFGPHTAGMEWNQNSGKSNFRWWAGAYSGPLDDDFIAAAKGPNGLRAAAELSAAKWANTNDGKPIPLAGQAMKVSGHNAWLAGYRVRTPDSWDKVPERAVVFVVVDVGRLTPSVFEVSVAQPKYQLLPDFNTLISSLRVIR